MRTRISARTLFQALALGCALMALVAFVNVFFLYPQAAKGG